MDKPILYVLQLVLKILAKLTLARYKPRVIGITGSVGKTSTKTAIYTVLKKGTNKNVRMSGGNLNTELGMPLAILGDYDVSGGALFWLRVILKAKFRLLFLWSKKSYPDVLVLEYGADKPGDIKKLVDIVTPDIGVVTAVGDIPVHIEFYDSANSIADEKANLIRNLGPTEKAILNIDDPRVHRMREVTLAEVMTFGFDSTADVRINDVKNNSKDGKPSGLLLKLGVDKNNATVEIDDVFGKSQAYAVAAATAVGLAEGMKLTTIMDALKFYEGVKGRTKLIPGIKNSFILDDTYNASPLSGSEALEILNDLDAYRKIAVLGDMLELGGHTEKAHIALGEHAAQVVDILVTVGARADFIAEGAIARGFPEKNIQRFDSSDDAKLAIQDLIKSGDLVLVKGSQGMRMEKIVLEIMAEPQRAKELLVRQYGKWLKS